MLKESKKNYPPETIGNCMITAVPMAYESDTISLVEEQLFKNRFDLETINYIYVINQAGKLSGVISIKELFRQEKDTLVSEVIKDKLIVISAQADREEAARLAISHNLKAIPVVDGAGYFLGVVPSDVILDILHAEHTEDMLHQAGIDQPASFGSDLLNISHKKYFYKRLPWLIFGLLGGLLAALIVDQFEIVLTEMLLLAAFIPAVVYMADAVGAQSQIIFIRQVSLDLKFDLKKYLKQEMIVGGLLALTLSLLVAILAGFWWSSISLAFILGLSFFFTIIMATLSGVILPWLFIRLKYDPAVASGPLATVIRDILSIIIYLTIALIVIKILI